MLRASLASDLAVIERRTPRHVSRLEARVPLPSALEAILDEALPVPFSEAAAGSGFTAVDARAWFYANVEPPATPVPSASSRRKRAEVDELVATVLKTGSPLDLCRTSPYTATPSSVAQPSSTKERPQNQRKHMRKSINDTFPDSPWK